MELKLRVEEIFDTQEITEKFKKREFVGVLEDNPEYPEFLKIELIQDKCDLLDKFNVGEKVSVSLNLKGRKYENKEGKVMYFNTIQAWRIVKDLGTSDGTPEHDVLANIMNGDDSEDDLLPF